MRTHNIAQLYKDLEALSESLAFTGVSPSHYPTISHLPMQYWIPFQGLAQEESCSS